MEFSLTLIIIILTVIVSIKAFSDHEFKHRLIFHPVTISKDGQFFRFLTSGFLHADWLHLIINMYVLYIFGIYLEQYYAAVFGSMGKILYVVMYLSAIIMANVSTYFKYKESPTYMSLGASGAVSAVVFALILFEPDMKLMLLFLPIPMPAFIFGLLYLAYSFFMSRKQYDNVNHEAHMYGALYGILFTIVLKPQVALHFYNTVINYL